MIPALRRLAEIRRTYQSGSVLRRLAVQDPVTMANDMLTLLTTLDRLAAGVRASWRDGEVAACVHCGAWDDGTPHAADCPVPLAEAVGRGELP
jgi:hypothetical protein